MMEKVLVFSVKGWLFSVPVTVLEKVCHLEDIEVIKELQDGIAAKIDDKEIMIYDLSIFQKELYSDKNKNILLFKKNRNGLLAEEILGVYELQFNQIPAMIKIRHNESGRILLGVAEKNETLVYMLNTNFKNINSEK